MPSFTVVGGLVVAGAWWRQPPHAWRQTARYVEQTASFGCAGCAGDPCANLVLFCRDISHSGGVLCSPGLQVFCACPLLIDAGVNSANIIYMSILLFAGCTLRFPINKQISTVHQVNLSV